MVIPIIAEYGEHVSIKFICRYLHRRNGDVMIYKKLPINDDRTLQNVLNIPSRDRNQQHAEIYVVKEEGSIMNTSTRHAVMSWADVHNYGELLSRRGDVFALGSFTQMVSLGQSSRSTLAEEAPGQRMFALGETRTQVNEDANAFQSDNSDEDINVLMRNKANNDFDDDGHEYPNIGEALHDTPHISFFTNLIGTDDVVGGRDLYDRCPTWSDVTPEFAKGMFFKDKDAVIRACNWYHVKKNKHYHVVETNKNVWSTRGSHDCPWKLRACLKKKHSFFEITQYTGPHTCLHGMESLDHRNINSTFIAHLIKTQVAKAWLGRTKAIAMVFGDWDASYKKLPKFMKMLELRNPGTVVILETLDLGIMGVRVLDRIFWAFRPFTEGFKHCPLVIGIDGTFLYGSYTRVLMIAMARIVTKNIFPLALALVESENYRDWLWFIHNVRHLIVPRLEGVTLISDRHAAIMSIVKHEWKTTRLEQLAGFHRYCLRHFKSNYHKNSGNVKVKDLIWQAGTAHQVRKFDEEIDSGRVRMSWLRHTFDVLPEHADDVSVQRHTCAYILRLIGGILLTDYSQTLVRVAYLPLLLDLDAVGAYSWGSAVLAMLYRSMCRAAKIDQKQIVGVLLLLQGHASDSRVCARIAWMIILLDSNLYL
ncbi:hypothetical protein Acr_18g0011860 [Actinidia rufa]|uniref:Uncharacterized protein n=1 Tax=Actinidia rufa TaxID=165716 RepID=A0A7J0G892_9ERIC|nr:hypothetical protein Acr_18g0011860 [Actinidia rufa]